VQRGPSKWSLCLPEGRTVKARWRWADKFAEVLGETSSRLAPVTDKARQQGRNLIVFCAVADAATSTNAKGGISTNLTAAFVLDVPDWPETRSGTPEALSGQSPFQVCINRRRTIHRGQHGPRCGGRRQEALSAVAGSLLY